MTRIGSRDDLLALVSRIVTSFDKVSPLPDRESRNERLRNFDNGILDVFSRLKVRKRRK